jgi:hypothetical protein
MAVFSAGAEHEVINAANKAASTSLRLRFIFVIRLYVVQYILTKLIKEDEISKI